MPDILIRNVPADDVARLDAQARRLGLSRSEYLRRHLLQQARRKEHSVRVADLIELADLLPDLADADVIRDAWS